MNLDLIRYVGLTIGLITLFSICRRFYFDWRIDKWHELMGISWDETYTDLETILNAWEDTEIASHVTNVDVNCGDAIIEIDKVIFHLSIVRPTIHSWKEYRQRKKQNKNTSYELFAFTGIASKPKKVYGKYDTLDNFIIEFPKVASFYVKQQKMNEKLDKLMEDF